MQQPIRVPGGTQNQPTGGVPGTVGPDLFNRPLTAATQGPMPQAQTPAVKPTMTPAGNVGATGPVQGASVPVPKPMLETPPAPARGMAR